jgi:glycosyltransferase involved in cell wall biosynthesis
MRIVQTSSFEFGGGAERIAYTLHQAYRERGHDAVLAVGKKSSDDPSVWLVPNDEARSEWYHFWMARHEQLQDTSWRLSRVAHDLANPVREVRRQLGHENFDYPGTPRLLDLQPDILHCHNLHNGYFDLRFLAEGLPVVLTLHDMWMLTGHCAYSLDCDRWQTGCGDCPYPEVYPKIKRDATAYNWQRKRDIYQQSRLYVSTPSQWLMDIADRSMLTAVQKRVIPYGIDLDVFHPAESPLDFPHPVILFVGSRASKNPYKDTDTIMEAVRRIQQAVTFVNLGSEAADEQLTEHVRLVGVPYQTDAGKIAQYYQAADVFIHAANADNFPLTVLESLACGTPVVATAVGGIPEQLTPQTGILTPPRDPAAMAQAITELLNDDERRRRMGQHAAEDARQRFDINRYVQDYLDWYEEILHDMA